MFVLGVALLARFYAYDRLAVVPLDQDTVSVSEGPGATIFDIATRARSRSTSCRPATSSVTWRPPRRRARSSAATSRCGRRSSTPTSLVPRSTPRARRARARTTGWPSTATPVRRSSAATPTPAPRPTSTAGTRSASRSTFEGLYFKFPFQTEKKTYPFWDGSLREAADIEFQETETIEGLEVYRFEQVIEPTTSATSPPRPRSSASTRRATSPSTASTPTPARCGSSRRPASSSAARRTSSSVAEYEGEAGRDPHRRHHRLQPRDDRRQRRHLSALSRPSSRPCGSGCPSGGILGLLLLVLGVVMTRALRPRRSPEHAKA